MEDNSSSDEEVKNSPTSPNSGGKKVKLNDGSSQDSLPEAGSSTKDTKEDTKEENLDSGLSADKSESTSSDDRGPSTSEGPSNEVVNVAPSSSNVRAILLNIIRPKRNYRKRKAPGRDSDSNDGSTDSDDYSMNDNMQDSRNSESNSDAESDDLPRLMAAFSEGTPSGSNSSSDSNDSYEIDDMLHMHSGDTAESDDDEGSQIEDNPDDQSKEKPPEVLNKTRPKHNYLMLREIINREMGLSFPCGKTTKADVMFENKFCGSLHSMYRLKKLHYLNKHRGCVNSINFHPEGQLLASGSDDTNIIVWDWARNKALQTMKTGHKSNVLQSKFLHLNAQSQLNIVTCARDGQVRLIQCPPSGGGPISRRRLASHSRPAHKLHVCPSEPHVVVSCGEDGLVTQCDVRAEHGNRLFQVKERGMTIQLYSICGHPLNFKELMVAGRDKFIRVYDRRKSTKPIAMYCPGIFHESSGSTRKRIRMSMLHLTCAVYNHDGSEILGSYNDEAIYLFDTQSDVYDKDAADVKIGYTHRYSGHRNSATFKGVSYLGPNSEFIASGSDCSNIFIWEKNSESIVQWMHGDVNGVVNCIEAHPRFPVIATSGLDKDVKIWIPRAYKDPDYAGLERIVRDNATEMQSPLFNDFLPSIYSAWQGEALTDRYPPRVGNIEFDGNVCTAF